MNVFDTLVFLGLNNVGRKTIFKIIEKKTNTPFTQLDDYLGVLKNVNPKVASNMKLQDIQNSIN